MATVIYCVETFWRNGRKLERGQLRQFADPATAQAVGQELGERMPGVLVYSITGEPEADYWDEPEEIARYGDVPAQAA